MFAEISYLFFSEIQEDFCLKIKMNSILNKDQQTFTLEEQRVHSHGFEDHRLSAATTQPGFPQQLTIEDGWDHIRTSARVTPSPSDLERGSGVRKV